MGVSNTRVAVSEMAKANLKGMIYYIKNFNRIRRTCKHADVDITKFHELYQQRDMEETHKDQEFVSTVDPEDWPKTLEMMEEYIRGF